MLNSVNEIECVASNELELGFHRWSSHYQSQELGFTLSCLLHVGVCLSFNHAVLFTLLPVVLQPTWKRSFAQSVVMHHYNVYLAAPTAKVKSSIT